MGGMAAQIPIRDDPEANEAAMARVRADKQREAHAGHDGTWVAHPGLAAHRARGIRRGDAGPEPARRERADVHVSARDLLAVPQGTITEAGCATASASACSTWRPGCAATAACRSIT